MINNDENLDCRHNVFNHSLYFCCKAVVIGEIIEILTFLRIFNPKRISSKQFPYKELLPCELLCLVARAAGQQSRIT